MSAMVVPFARYCFRLGICRHCGTRRQAAHVIFLGEMCRDCISVINQTFGESERLRQMIEAR
jgi:hypothetical protein